MMRIVLFHWLMGCLVFATGFDVKLNYNVVGWYDLRPQYVTAVPVTTIDFAALSHLVVGKPNISANGTISCTPYSKLSNVTSQLRTLATAHGVKLQWVISDDTEKLLHNSDAARTFLTSLAEATQRCECDGIEFDFEPGSSATPAMIDAFTEFLVTIKHQMGNDFTVSADVAAWTHIPYITPSKMHGIDFVNLMSYFFDANGSVQPYVDALSTLTKWGFNNSLVNVGIPYYDNKQSAWADIADQCPDVAVDVTTCGGTMFVGKTMNVKLGQLVQQGHYAGVFPWQLNYDTVSNNNQLFPWLLKGLTGPTPPPTPPPTPGKNDPVYFPLQNPVYIFNNRSAAQATCHAHGFVGLCIKEQLKGHSLCKAGWTLDWEGYWLATASAGCGSAGYNDWDGPAGAFCCGLKV